MSKSQPAGVAHIAIAVKSLSDAVPAFENLFGVPASEPEIVESQKVRLQFVEIGGVRFEFLEPTSPDSPITKFLDKRGNGIHHLAFAMDGVAQKLKDLKAAGVPLIDEIPKKGAENCDVAFLHPKAAGGILVELIERHD